MSETNAYDHEGNHTFRITSNFYDLDNFGNWKRIVGTQYNIKTKEVTSGSSYRDLNYFEDE